MKIISRAWVAIALGKAVACMPAIGETFDEADRWKFEVPAALRTGDLEKLMVTIRN